MHWIDQTIVILFLVFFLMMGLRKKARQESDATGAEYILGGRQLTLPAFVATTVSTWYGGILGVGEYTFKYGISNWLVFGVPYYVGAVLFALLLSRRARKGNTLTLPQMLGEKFGKPVKYCSALLILLTTLPAAYLLIVGILLEFSFKIPIIIGIIGGAIFIVAYLWRGGFSAVVHTDKFQMILMFGGFIMLAALLLGEHGIEPILTLDAKYLSWNGGLPIGSVLVWYFIALSTLVEPNFFQRCYAAKSPEVARKGLLISVVCWVVFDMLTTLCGLYARALLPDLSNPLYSFPVLASTVLPPGVLGVFMASLFATVLSTLDSGLFLVATTLGRDLLTSRSGDQLVKWTQIGLIVGAIGSSCIALMSDSVISVWHLFGSLAGATLLIPTIIAYYEFLRVSRLTVLIMMVSSAAVTFIWILSKVWTGEYWGGIEPLFPGIGLSLIVFSVGKIRFALNKIQ